MDLFDEMMRNDQYQTTQYLCIRRPEIMKLSQCNKAPIFLQRLARLKNLLHCCFETGNNLTVDMVVECGWTTGRIIIDQ